MAWGLSGDQVTTGTVHLTLPGQTCRNTCVLPRFPSVAATTPSNTLVGTTGNDILTSPGSVSTLVQGLQGNDTISLSLGTDWAEAGEGNDRIKTTAAIYSGSIEAGDGNDFVTALSPLLNGAYVGLNAGNDSINFLGSSLNATIGAGADNDLLSLTGSTFTTSVINGGKGADTFALATTTLVASTLQGGEGQDRIVATALTSDFSSFISAGKGTDSIVLGGGTATVAGGGLEDTITYVTAAGAAVIFGDAVDVTTEGTGTDGAADGADLISMTAGFAGTTVYGAGGNDTIKFGTGSAAQIWGGNGADLISVASTTAAISETTIDGGNGQDTISLNRPTNSALVLGGAGEDSIFLLSVSSTTGGSVNGGDGNDTISMIAAADGLNTSTKIVTVDGGAGADLIGFNLTGGSFAAASNSAASSALIGQVAYEVGDSIKLGSGLGVATAGANWLGAAPTVFVAGSITAIDGFSTAVGSIAVFDSGDDLVIGIAAGAGQFVSINVIGGDDAIKTTVVGTAVAFNSSNFGFTLGQSNGSMTISFT